PRGIPHRRRPHEAETARTARDPLRAAPYRPVQGGQGPAPLAVRRAWLRQRMKETPVHTDFSGDVAIVTGGAGGLGEACVRALAAAGCGVVIADLADERGEVLATELGEKVRYARTDVLDDDAVGQAIEA